MGIQLPQKGEGHEQYPPPHFSAHVYCGQMAGWIKMPLGKIPLVMEAEVGPGHTVLDGDSSPPLFSPCLLWPNGRPSQQLLSSCYLREKNRAIFNDC